MVDCLHSVILRALLASQINDNSWLPNKRLLRISDTAVSVTDSQPHAYGVQVCSDKFHSYRNTYRDCVIKHPIQLPLHSDIVWTKALGHRHRRTHKQNTGAADKHSSYYDLELRFKGSQILPLKRVSNLGHLLCHTLVPRKDCVRRRAKQLLIAPCLCNNTAHLRQSSPASTESSWIGGRWHRGTATVSAALQRRAL